ncbi:MAG: glycosyltransferase family 4 protein [Tannerellaceae bacterium]|jgi:glycosyltransferase involved in cell wall biosynthesis|nr:glycosyltransferase family 4 protein [Tannerellaceae bacterium]
MKHIVCFHLFNDYSGSPKVLKMVLTEILDRGYRVDLVSSVGGVLDELQGCEDLHKINYRYIFSGSPAVAMLRYAGVQIYTFLLAFRYLGCKNTFYINTLLPVGPALAGRLMGKRVIYHYHENAMVKGVFYRILCWCMQHLASGIICVSEYQRSYLKREKNVCIVPNALPETFAIRLVPNPDKAFARKKVLMLGSLKRYKGTLGFIRLAWQLPQYSFELVINDTESNIDHFITEHDIEKPVNLELYPCQKDVTPFYNKASVVLNLSDKNSCIETFGLTALEAMSAGLPVIVPTVGGIAEIVEDGVNGYKIDVQELEKVSEHIQLLLSDKALYHQLSKNALAYAKKVDVEAMINSILSVL